MSKNIAVISLLLYLFALGLRLGIYIPVQYSILLSVFCLFLLLVFFGGMFKDGWVQFLKDAHEFIKSIWVSFLTKINYPLVNKYESRIKNYENIIKGLQKNLENKTNEHDTPTSAIEESLGTYR